MNPEQELGDCEWIKSIILEYILNYLQCGYMPHTDQLEGDMMRRIWIFIDTMLDSSNMKRRGYSIILI